MRIIGNWGVLVPAFYILFVIVLVSFVVWSTFQRVELVDDNYYEQEIKYQNQVDKIQRTNNLSEKLELLSYDNAILIQFPANLKAQKLSGEILFFRPSESKLDFKVKLQPDSLNQFIIPTDKLKKGLWKLKIDWAAGDSAFYNEEIVVF